MPSSIPEMIHGNFNCSDIAKCVLGLKSLDLDSYRLLVQKGAMTAEELGEILNRERSTAYRALQNLMTCGLVYRETKTIEGGGYYYIYKALDPCKLKDMVQENINTWHEKMSALTQDIEKEILEQP
ncbi:MAG: helix-turn-helix domain-containing protein [ANME-2 cluster archaeon]|nr:helix-turn-helix domain-containing protein [ANME-2 cluster archaeon]